MENIQLVIDQIPIRHNLVSHLILLGVFQGFFIATILIVRASDKILSIRLFGFFFLALSLVMLDDYLCYTGLMKYTPNLNDSTEPLVLLWAPLIYLFINGLVNNREFSFIQHWKHFVIPILYPISQFGYYMHPKSVKLNAYIAAYFPDMQRIDTPAHLNYSYLLIKDQFQGIIILSFTVYIILSIYIIVSNSNKYQGIKRGQYLDKYSFSKKILSIFFGLMLIILSVFLFFENDLGDHYIGLVQSIFIFTVSTMMMSESRFFQKSWLSDKYESLGTLDFQISIDDVKDYIEKEKYYIKKDATLNGLAESLKVNPHYISKTINLKTGMNFNEFINSYRVNLSKARLTSIAFDHLTIEAIGNSVGFNSKSAFYNAFKQNTRTSPSVYKRSHRKTNLS